MKSVGFSIFFLLCTVTWIAAQVEEIEDDLNEVDAEAIPIISIFTYSEDDYALSLYNRVKYIFTRCKYHII